MEDQNSNRPLYDYTSRLRLTLKAWPVIALATIGLCYLTQLVAGLFGVELPDQESIALVKRCAGWNWNFTLLCLQILILMPAIEECLFRWSSRFAWRKTPAWIVSCAILSALFSFAHYPDYQTIFKVGEFVLRPMDAAFLALFFFGFAQCWLYRRTGRLGYAILNHGLFNLTNLILLFILPEAS